MAAVYFYDNDMRSLLITGTSDELAKIIALVDSMNSNDAIKKAFGDEEDYEEHDAVNHPAHYEHGIECIDEMILLYGVVETMIFCKLNQHKYRKRAFDKGGKEDMDKADWYMKEYAYLDSKSDLELKEEIYKKYNLLDN